MMDGADFTPTEFFLKLYAGDLNVVELEMVDEVDAPINLSGKTWTAMWRRERTAKEKIDFAVDASQSAAGILKVSVTAANTRQTVGTGVWDLQGVPVGGGDPETLLGGPVFTTEDVTR